ncbi:MAG: energy-coupling factor transporter ATPase [Candidatus Fimenecus sp.]
MVILEAKNLTYTYSQGTPFEVKALNNISFKIEKGEYIGIIGHTGSGKSTLLQILNGLIKPQSGKIMLYEQDINSSKKLRHDAHFKIGLCFQYPEYQLFESTVKKDIEFGPKNMGLSGESLEKSVLTAAETVGLKKELLEKSPFELSGGEKRRVAIAGIIAMNPEILILDEPAAGLDPEGRNTVFNMIDNFRKRTGATVIMVSHSMEDIAVRADRIIVMNNFQIFSIGTVNEIFSDIEELVKIGLDAPQITKLMLDLKNKGFNVKTDIYTISQAKDEILKLIRV